MNYIRAEGRAGRMGAPLLAVVAESGRQRVYIEPSPEHERAAEVERPTNNPDGTIADNPRWFFPPAFGFTEFADVFTSRQLTSMCTFSDLVLEARDRVLADALQTGIDEGLRLADGGAGAAAYADAVATYLGFTVSKTTARNNTMCTWEIGMDRLRGSFQRQAMPMTWDFAETNPLEAFGGGFLAVVQSESEVLDALYWPTGTNQYVVQRSATDAPCAGSLISTDPPYYDKSDTRTCRTSSTYGCGAHSGRSGRTYSGRCWFQRPRSSWPIPTDTTGMMVQGNSLRTGLRPYLREPVHTRPVNSRSRSSTPSSRQSRRPRARHQQDGKPCLRAWCARAG